MRLTAKPASLVRITPSPRDLAIRRSLKPRAALIAEIGLHRKPGHPGRDASRKADWPAGLWREAALL